MPCQNKRPARPILWTTLFYCLGILLEKFFDIGFGIVSAGTFLMLVLAVLSLKRTHLFSIFLLSAFIGVGFIHAKSVQSVSRNHIVHSGGYFFGKETIIRGEIISDVEEKKWNNTKRYSYRLRLKEIRFPEKYRKKEGIIIVNSFQPSAIACGDVVELTGKLHRPFNFKSEGNFFYQDYLKAKNIYFIFSVKKGAEVKIIDGGKQQHILRMFYGLRQKLKHKLSIYLSEQEAALMQAILLGERGGISSHINKIFERTGTVHILAISGLNIGIVAGIIFLLIKLLPLSRKGRVLLTIVLILAYACLTGGSPSVVRAAIMTSVFFMSFILEKETDQFNTLALAALLILLTNPSNLFDIGFQLSFICVATIIFFAPFLRALKEKERGRLARQTGWFIYVQKIYFSILESIFISTVVWIFIAGFIVYYFGIVTPATILANIVIVPVVSGIVILGMGLLLTAFFSPFLAYCFSLCIKCSLNFMVGAAFIFSKMPLAYFYMSNIKLWKVIIYYILMFFVAVYFQGLKRKNLGITVIDSEKGVC